MSEGSSVRVTGLEMTNAAGSVVVTKADFFFGDGTGLVETEEVEVAK